MIANANVKIDWAPNHAGMSVVLDAGALVPQGPDLFRSAGLAILGSHHDRLALALRLELEAIDRGIKAVYASAHEQAHIFAHELFSQKRFWRLYRDIGGLTGRRTFGRNDVTAGPTGPLPELELSSRQISQILRRMLAGLSQSDQDGLSLVTFLRTILFKQVAALAAFKAACMRREPVAAGTLRDRVLSLEIHTGSSPPATAAMSLAACKVTLPIAALQVNYKTICQQDHRTHRNDPLQRRHPPAHYGGSVRDHAASRRLSLSSGHRRHRPDQPFHQDRRALRPAGRGQVVRHLPMVGGFWRLSDSSRTAVGLP
jgi:hypothetical protein